MKKYDVFVIGSGMAGVPFSKKGVAVNEYLQSTFETINLFAMAIKTKMKINELRTMIFTYPTLSSDIPHML